MTLPAIVLLLGVTAAATYWLVWLIVQMVHDATDESEGE